MNSSSSSPPRGHEEEEEGGGMQLPRSILWRLRLGLLQQPPATSSLDQLHLEQVITHNLSLLQNQQEQFEQCQESYREHLAVRDLHDVELEEEQEEQEQQVAATAVQAVGHNNNDGNNNNNSNNNSSAIAAAVDPLTAMLMEQQAQEERRQELDLRYRKERARRKRGVANAVNQNYNGGGSESESQPKKVDHDALSIIDKDLLRLPCPDGGGIPFEQIADETGENSHVEPQITTSSSSWNSTERQQSWMEALREILYIYSQEHSHIGYRQGMHEIASYLWLVLERDRNENNNNNNNNNNSTLASQHQHDLFGKAAAYGLLKSILNGIRQAFDVKVASNSKPLEDMSRSILSKIKQQYVMKGETDQLTPLLEALSVPPQLYCTKWIRLLFSREVVGSNNVLKLWDTFVGLVAEGWEWMAILESAAASRILLCKDRLVLTTVTQSTTTAAYHHRVMDLLMNMPALDNVDPLVQQLKQLLSLPKYQQPLPQGQQHKPSRHQPPQTQIPMNRMDHNNSHGRDMMYSTNATQNNWMHPSADNNGIYHNRNSGNGMGNAFSLRAVKESLEQGVEKLSHSSDTWRKRLAEEWTTLKQQQQQQQQQSHNFQGGTTGRSYGDHFMDASLFADDDKDFVPIPPSASGAAMHPLGPQSQPSPFVQSHQQMLSPPPDDFYRSGGTAEAAPIYGNLQIAQPQQQQQQQHYLSSQSGLAQRLGASVSVLQEFVMNVAREQDQMNSPMDVVRMTNNMNDSTGSSMESAGSTRIPSAVWEALADVEAVRNALLQPSQQQR